MSQAVPEPSYVTRTVGARDEDAKPKGVGRSNLLISLRPLLDILINPFTAQPVHFPG